MNTPYFSVIVVSYNAGEKLNKTIKTILEQSYNDLEIIIKDGCSADGSLDELPQDSRIRAIVKKDSGIYDAMNEAVRAARGEYLYFLNCGDVLHDKDVLADVYKIIQSDHNVGKDNTFIYYGDVIEKSSGQHVMANPEMDHFAMYRYLPCHQACFYAREAFRERVFDTQYKVRADYEHFIWCVIKKQCKAVYLNMIVSDYEGGGFSETAEGRRISKEEHEKIAKIYFTEEELRHYKRYMLLTLQPLREKLAQSKLTAPVYDGIKNFIYKMKNRKKQ